MKIQDHPVGSRFPKETASPSVQKIHDNDFRPLIARPNFPKFEDMIRQRLSSLSLHISSFHDATIVSLTWPHVLMDAFGAKGLLIAWSSVLAGKEEGVQPVLGAREDFLRKKEEIRKDVKEEDFQMEEHRLTGLSLVMFSLRFLWGKIWGPRRERKIVLIPKSSFTKMKAKAQQEAAESSQEGEGKPFISDSDILTAWFSRAVALQTPSRPLTVLNLLNLRFRVPLLLRSGGVFLQNMVLGTYSFLNAPASQSVGSIALDHRKHCAKQGTERQAVCFLESSLRDIDAGGTPRFLFGESNAVIVAFNNLLKADVMQAADFSPSVLSQGDVSEIRSNALGTMTSYFNGDIDSSFSDLHIFVVLGTDSNENYWILGCVHPRTWQSIEKELKHV